MFWQAAWVKAWDAALNAAQNAEWDSAWDASREVYSVAWNAVQNVLQDAAWDAALYADFIIVSDLEFRDKEKHRKHVEARWEVWRKGYGLLCDMDGLLYVYAGRSRMKA